MPPPGSAPRGPPAVSGLIDLFSQGLNLVTGRGHGGAQGVGDPGIGIGDQEPHLGQHLLDALRDEEAQFTEETSEGVHLGGSRGDRSGAEAVNGSEDVLGMVLTGTGWMSALR